MNKFEGLKKNIKDMQQDAYEKGLKNGKESTLRALKRAVEETLPIILKKSSVVELLDAFLAGDPE